MIGTLVRRFHVFSSCFVPKDWSCIFKTGFWKIGILLRCTKLPFKLKKALYNYLFRQEKIKWDKDRWLNLGTETEKDCEGRT